ncbi:hypothetical protein ACINJI_003443 [Cronobacter dublinensis]
MTFSLRTMLIFTLSMTLLAVGYGEIRYRNGWYAHADHITALVEKKKEKVSRAVQTAEQKGAQAASEGKVFYRTITRDVVRYVQDPNRTRCDFDDESVRLRQRAIDAANNIAGFDGATMQAKPSGE